MGIPFDKAVRYFLLADILTGFRLGMKYFFKPKVTINYPFEKGPLSPRFRGELVLRRDLRHRLALRLECGGEPTLRHESRLCAGEQT